MSEPEALIAWFAQLGLPIEPIGLEAGPLSQWLYAAMAKAGLAVELLGTRHVRAAFKTMPVKTDKKDARGIAQLMRMGWFCSVHCKSLPAQEVREVFAQELRGFERRVRAMARDDERSRRLMTTPGVGVLVALTFVAAIDEAGRFRSSRMVGAHFGLTPKKYQSGETDYTGRISKNGDAGVRTALYEAANIILMRPTRSSDLKTWAQGVAKRAGPRKAKVALARKLSVVLHRMLRDQTDFVAHKAAPAMAAA